MHRPPIFPTGAPHCRAQTASPDAYRTGRGSDPDAGRGRDRRGQGVGCTQLVITELPYQVNRDSPVPEDRRTCQRATASKASPTSSDGVQRRAPAPGSSSTLKRDAVAKVVLNNLYKHTQLQDNFGGQHACHRRRRSPAPCASTSWSVSGSSTRSRSSSDVPASSSARTRSGRTSSRGCVIAQDHARRGHRTHPRIGVGGSRAHAVA